MFTIQCFPQMCWGKKYQRMFTKSTTRKCLQSQFEMLTNNLSTDSHILFCIIVQTRLQKSKQIQKHKHKHIITHSWLSTSNHFHSWLMIVWVAAGRSPINPLIHRTWQDRQINGFICRLYLTNNIQTANWMSSLIQIQLPSNQLVANPATPPSLSQKRGVDSQRQRLASRSDTSTITPINCLPEMQNVTSMAQVDMSHCHK